MNLRRVEFILLFFATVLAASSAETNYVCIICGQGPLSGRIWIAPRGAVCDTCYRLENRCSLCGLPIRPGDGAVKTGDGRFICKFDKQDAVVDAAEARVIFAESRRGLLELFGSGLALKYPEVTVNVFNVDYWSERGRTNGLHKFGFSSTRKTASGACTHEVVMLSGRRRSELAATAAHEYTHLWINENRPDDAPMDPDAVEAICELAAYQLMGAERQPEMQKKILDNPYTHGKTAEMVALAEQRGMAFILNWVKNGTTTSPDAALVEPLNATALRVIVVPPQPPDGLKFTGFSVIGTNRTAIINGEGLGPSDQKTFQLRSNTVAVVCRAVREDSVLLQSNGMQMTLKLEKK